MPSGAQAITARPEYSQFGCPRFGGGSNLFPPLATSQQCKSPSRSRQASRFPSGEKHRHSMYKLLSAVPTSDLGFQLRSITPRPPFSSQAMSWPSGENPSQSIPRRFSRDAGSGLRVVKSHRL